MRSTRRTGVLAITASLALTAIAIPSTGIAAGIVPDTGVQAVVATNGETTPPELVPAGKLVLTTASATGSVVRLDINGSPVGGAQSLSESGSDTCKGLGGADGALLKFAGFLNEGPVSSTTPRVGFSKGSIGVKETSSEQFCNQIDTTSPNTWFTKKFVPETLVLSLPASGLSDPKFGPLKATSASLDVELINKDSRILVTAGLAGQPQAYYELRTGTFRAATTPPGPLVATTLPYKVFPSESTTAAAVGPNIQWPISDGIDGVTFDSLSIRAYNGAISLEGKADADSAAATSIDLGYVATDVVNTCNALLADGNTDVKYIGNVTDTTTNCASFNAVLSGTNEEVRLLKPRDPKNPNAQFIFDIKWTVPVDTYSPSELPPTLINFELTGSEDNKMPFCPTSAFTGGQLSGVAPADLIDIPDFENRKQADGTTPIPGSEGTQYACVGSRTVALDGTDLKITDEILTIGDLRMSLGR